MSPRPHHKIHNVRFLSLTPASVSCLAYSPEAALLAVSRADNSIEVWNVAASPFLQRWFPGNSESSVECLCWAPGPRLFSAGLHGLVLEHDLDALATKHQFAATSGAAWCMQYHRGRNRIAVGTEQGYVCLFEVTAEGLVYDRVLDKQEGRILCLAWHSAGGHIVTGSPDTIRVWDVDSGHPTARISTGRSEIQRETVVWSVAVTDDFTIISGDSRGKTCFWNGKMGTQMDAYQSHKADVLSVALSPKQDVAYSSGCDPVMMHFQPVVRGEGMRKKWVKSIHRNVHSHDVRSIVATQRTIFSGGIDCLLAVNDITTRSMAMYAPVPHGDCVVLAEAGNLVVMRHPTYLEVWKLGAADSGGAENGEWAPGSVLKLATEPEKVLELHSKDDETIRSCAVSPDGAWVAYASCTRLRAYRLTLGDQVRLERASVECDIEIPHHIRFYGGCKMVSATERGSLQFFEFDEREMSVRLMETVEGKDLHLSGGISHLAATAKGDVVVAVDYAGNVSSLDAHSRKFLAKMPRYQRAAVTALSLNPTNGDLLVLAYADNHVVECHARSGRYSKFSKSSLETAFPKQWKSKKTATRGAVQLGVEQLVLWDDANICVVDRKCEGGDVAPRSKQAKDGETATTKKRDARQVRITRKYEHLVHLGALSDGALVAVEVRPQSIEGQLPPSLRQKKFGAM